MYLVTADGMRRRLRRKGGELRTALGLDDLSKPAVGRIVLADIRKADVVAPYAPSKPTLGILLIGVAIGMLVSSFLIPSTAVFGISLAAATAGGALFFVRLPGSSRYALVRVHDGDRSWMIAVEREALSDFQQSIPKAQWRDDIAKLHDTDLLEEERRHVNAMRNGVVLITTSLAMIALLFLQLNLPFEPALSGPPLVQVGAWVFLLGEIAAFAVIIICLARMWRILRGPTD